MGNFISQTVNGANIVVSGDTITIKKNGHVYNFPLQGNKNSLSISNNGSNKVYINNHYYDLDKLEDFQHNCGYDPKKKRKKTFWSYLAGIFR